MELIEQVASEADYQTEGLLKYDGVNRSVIFYSSKYSTSVYYHKAGCSKLEIIFTGYPTEGESEFIAFVRGYTHDKN